MKYPLAALRRTSLNFENLHAFMIVNLFDHSQLIKMKLFLFILIYLSAGK